MTHHTYRCGVFSQVEDGAFARGARECIHIRRTHSIGSEVAAAGV